MLSTARVLLADRLLLAGVLQCHNDTRIKSNNYRLLPLFLNPELFQDDSHGTKLGKSKLEKVKADKSRK